MVLISYLHPLNLDSVGKGIAVIIFSKTDWEQKDLKNFDQWMEELSKKNIIQNDEQETKPLWKADENLAEDDSEEEE
jgi:hypothetical protein